MNYETRAILIGLIKAFHWNVFRSDVCFFLFTSELCKLYDSEGTQANFQ
jgi:hypothetical protein